MKITDIKQMTPTMIGDTEHYIKEMLEDMSHEDLVEALMGKLTVKDIVEEYNAMTEDLGE